jgi:hypothetical protein
MSTECNKDESRDIGTAVACLFTNVFFQPPYCEKKVVM